MATDGTIHATLRDISTGFILIAGSHYLWSSSSIPDSYAGVVVFYVGTLGAASDFSGVTHKADSLLSPPETENTDVKTSTRLAPTVSGRTLDVTATGGAGIDWSNVENPTATVALSGTTVGTVSAATVADKTGFKLASDGTDLVLVAGKTLPHAIQIIGATTAGKISGAGTSLEVFQDFAASDCVSIVADSSGNRTSATYAV